VVTFTDACGDRRRHPVEGKKNMGSQAPGEPTAVLVATSRGVLFGSSLQALAMQPGIRLVTEPLAAARSLLPTLRRHLPDVLLLDEPIFDQLDARSRDRLARIPDLRILLVCKELSPRVLQEILRRGFDGVVEGDCRAEDCLKAVRAVSRGEFWLPRAMLIKAISRLMYMDGAVDIEAPPPASTDGTLTGRESQIVEFVKQGFTNKEIGRHLGIMEDTVKKHLQNVFAKLGVRRRTQVAMTVAKTTVIDRRVGRVSASL
jgi:DNA-binding NarL/FixJ family response regulator